MQRFAGRWFITARPLEGSGTFLVSPVTLSIPENALSFDLWVLGRPHGRADTPERIALTVVEIVDGVLRAGCDHGGWRYALEARLMGRPGSGHGEVLQALVSCWQLPDGAPSEDTESFTGVRPGGT